MRSYGKDVSVISIIGNEAVYQDWLKKSIDAQKGIEIEQIPIFNIDNVRFHSARAALNYGAELAKGKYLLFAHQDICFLNSNVVKKIYDYAESLNDFGVIGVAGCRGGDQYAILTNIIQGEKGMHVGKPIVKATEVMTVDECVFLIKKEQWERIHFSENVGWHLYAVEYCLEMLDAGRKNYVVPSMVWHKSDGVSLDYLYCDQVLELLEKYQNKFRYLNTTVKQWPTSLYGRKLYIPYYRIKQKIKHFIYD